VGAGSREEVRGDDRAEGSRPSRTGPRFRNALERKRRDLGGAPDEGASAAAMAGWFRSESGPAAPQQRPGGVAAASGARPVDRVLVGAGPDGAEARIRIGAGALAGTEIQLSTGGVGHAIEARLLTHAASSRQTLSMVMDEIRLRLRDRGIVLSAKLPNGRGPPRVDDADGLRDDLSARAPGEGAGPRR